MIQEFNKENLSALRQAMNKELAKLEKQFGIQIEVGNARYSGNEVTFKTKCNTIGEGGKAQTKEAQNWALYAPLNNLSHFNLGDKVSLNGQVFTIEGWNTRARKSPVQIKCDTTGGTYKCSALTLVHKQPIK